MFQLWRRATALVIAGFMSFTSPVSAEPVKVAAVQAQPADIKPTVDLARSDRRSNRSSQRMEMSEKKASKRFSYSYLLPFGVGQFEQNKTILGTTLATAQAGFLLLYFDRSNAVRASNSDAADVMRGVDPAAARNDAGLVSFLDQNEAFTKKAQQQANLALLGFFTLYTAGVVEAIFDPLARFNSGGGSGSRKKRNDRSDATTPAPSRLVQELREEQTAAKVGVFVDPTAGSGSTVGLAIQKPL